MDKNEIVKQIYKITKQNLDRGLEVLEILALLKGADTDTVLEQYKKLIAGELVIVEVKSKSELSSDQKNQLSKKVESKFSDKELVFDFNVSERNNAGILIKVNDNVLDGTI